MRRDGSRIVVIAGLLIATSNGLAATEPRPEPKRLTSTVTVDAVYSPDGSWIAFASNRMGNDPDSLDVYRMNADGTHLERLTNDPANDEQPAISPDGRWIAFMSMRTGNPEIHVMRSDGSEVRQLTNDPGWDIHPRWAPDGARVLFNSTRGSVNTEEPELFELYLVSPDGSGLRQVTHDKAVSTYAMFTPDGRRIVYRRIVAGNSEVFVANADGSGQVNLTDDAAFDGWPAWSPDGTRIAFASNRGGDEKVFEIYLMNGDGSSVQKLTVLGARSTAPEFARDGRSILFTRAGAGFADLYSIPVP
jgi:TolB protein